MDELEGTINKGRETETQMRQRLERLQIELENTNKRIEQIQRGSGYGARANRAMNFGSEYSGGSKNSSNRR